MSRLINADKLKKDILDMQDCYNGFSDTYDKACIIGVIDEQPTIEERKTGKWLETDSYEPCWFKCDQCGRLSDIKEIYCPTCGASMVNTTCGADMRGEE